MTSPRGAEIDDPELVDDGECEESNEAEGDEEAKTAAEHGHLAA